MTGISPSGFVIRRIRQAHCARGPARCARCREMDREVIALLDIAPPQQGLVARPTLPVAVGGQQVWREFDVVRVFESEEEARAYAEQNGVVDVEI